MALELELSLPMQAPTGAAVASPACQIKVLAAEFVAALAMRLRSFLGGMGGNGLLLRLGVIPARFFGKDLFRRPALRDAPVESPRVDPGLVGQLRYMHEFTAKANDAFRAHVAALFFRCSPSAILWTVIAIGVFAFKSMPRRTWRHVLYKTPERFLPTITDTNTPTAVAMKASALWVVAPVNHQRPSAVQGVFGFSNHKLYCKPIRNGGE